eukprot:TRINITY_DN4975_c0_g1_i3.p1 TRINITY_DN4975_c0_g1~~TRINITY_DN4975_c0_g1_i3.p1  ORF type:complete len:242 (+),score=51.22 TRINITY_DN4975_c0_g1_i3:569-1294(+)
MAQALGYQFFTKDGNLINTPATGKDLQFIERIDASQVHSRLSSARFLVACDVTNPLTGPFGASKIYGPQKGASPSDVEQLENGMVHMQAVLERTFSVSVDSIIGGGAAGGLGAALVCFCKAQQVGGFEWISKSIGIQSLMKEGVDLVITTEGRVDKTTSFGKGPVAVAKIASQYKVPTVILCGSNALHDCSDLYENGVTAIFPIVSGPCTLSEALQNAEQNLRQTTIQVIRTLSAFLKSST